MGLLYYATVTVQGTAVRAFMDPGSSSTVMSFQLFCKIAQVACVPTSAVQKLNILLGDYSHRPITVGACVQLTISYTIILMILLIQNNVC